MKWIITIIILGLLGWGVWAMFNDDEDTAREASPAAAVQGLDNVDLSSDSEAGVDLGEFEDKG